MDEGWKNTGFSDLLAHVEMAAVDSGRGTQTGNHNAAGVADGSSFPISDSPIDNNGLQETSYNNMFLDLDLNIPIVSNSWNDDMDYRTDITQYEFPGLYHCSYDHSSPPEAFADIASNGSIPLQFEPKTPDVGKRAQQSHHCEIGNICQEEGLYLEKNKKQDAVDQIGHNTIEFLCEETFLRYEPNFSSVAASTQLEENDVLDNAKEETGIDLPKTPAQKAKKRKIRPRVVLEGEVKGTPKSKVKEKSKDSESKKTLKSNVKEKSNGENQSGKRRYTRKNESKSSNAPLTDVVEEATTDQVVVKSCKRKLRFQGYWERLTLIAGSESPPPDTCTEFNGSAGTKASQQLAQGQEVAVESSSAVEFDFNLSCTELLEDYISLPENLSNCEVLQTRKSHGSHENDVLKDYKRKRTENNHNTFDSSLFSSMSSVLHGAREAVGCRQSDVKASPSASYITEQNAVVPYGGDGRMVPYEGLFDPSKKRLLRAKVDLDPEDDRVWKLLMGIDTSNGVEGTSEDKEKRWEEQRRLFCGRADLFIKRMHLIQGDRRFSKWNGSILDSVIGVYLTQNVSDHLSSSAFISLAARFPLKSTCYEGPEILVEEPEECTVDSYDPINWQKNMLSKLVSGQGFVTTGTRCGSSVEAEDKRELDVLLSRGSVVSSQNLIDSSIFPSAERNLSKDRGSVLEDNDMGMLEDVVSSQGSVDSSILSIDELDSSCSERDPTTCCTSKTSSQVMQQAHSTSTNFQGETLHETAKNVSKVKRSLEEKENKPFDWDSLRKEVYQKGLKREKNKKTMDSLDWEAVRCADVREIAEAIKERGMNNILAGRIKDFLNRLVSEHESLDLEWLRDVPPDKAKDYLLSIKGVGLKSTECVRLLTLHHHAFPVDTNVGRIAVRLGWVPLQPLPESLQIHLLEMYPMMESIQKYLWPRLCTLDQPTLYELHYQMITFGKVFCTKLNPNCNECPMRAECRHFASKYASAKLALPGPEEKGIVTSFSLPVNSVVMSAETMPVHLLEADPLSEIILRRNECEPIIEEPETIEDEYTKIIERDIEDDFDECPNEIPSIDLTLEDLILKLQNCMQKNMEIQEGEVSKALVVVSSEDAAIPDPKLKNVKRLRTEHQVYELPDAHPLLERVARRDPGDHCYYLLAIWSPGETAQSFQPPERCCSSQESSNLCNKKTCSLCNSMHEAETKTVRGTLLIPCRTAMRGSFPLNGTYFQVNEVFADHETSLNPINVPRSWIGLLPKRSVLFGTSITTIVKGLSMKEIQKCFSKGYICVRGFDQKLRVPRPLVARLHFPISKIIKNKTKDTL